ncbi:MAG: amino acid permease, partial [Actinomycetota bacterium]|nr:amino acid permease [Actinomycetota bacterium]
GTVLAFVNALLLGWGASVWGGGGSLWFGLVGAAIIVPVFAYRHYVQDKGTFPDSLYEDLPTEGGGRELVRRAGSKPYLVLAGGVLMVVVGQILASVSG